MLWDEFFLSQRHPLPDPIAHLFLETLRHLVWVAFELFRFIFFEDDGIKPNVANPFLQLLQLILGGR